MTANKIYKDISAKCKTCGKDFTIMVKDRMSLNEVAIFRT